MASSTQSPKSPFAFWFTIIFAVAIVGFGFYGFMRTYEQAMGSWDFMTVYGKTVELFRPVPVIFVNGAKLHEHWALTVAQALGRTFVVVAFIATVLAVFHEYVSVILFRRARGHSIFIGLGHRGRDLALAKSKGISFEEFIREEQSSAPTHSRDNHPVYEVYRGVKGACRESLAAVSPALPNGRVGAGAAKQKVAAIELDEKKEVVHLLRASGALVLVGDGEDRSILWKAKVSHAAQVFILTGDDYTNLRVCEAVFREREHVDPPAKGLKALIIRPWRFVKTSALRIAMTLGWKDARPELEILVAVESQDLRSFLHERWELVTQHRKDRPLVRVIGFQAVAVRSCISRCFETLALEERIRREGLRFLIAGTREFILDVLRSAVVFSQISGQARPCIWVAGSEGALLDYIRARYPALDLVADVSFVHCDPVDVGWVPHFKGLRFDACFLSCADEALTISSGNQLCCSSLFEAGQVMAFVNGAPQARIKMKLPDQMNLVSVFESGAKVIENGFWPLEKQAMDQHESYLRTIQAKERKEREMRGEVFDWENLPEAKKESNRVAILHGAIKKRVWESLQPANAEQQNRALEDLSISEHGRWMAEKIMDGFVYGKESNAARRIHKDLRPWDDLSEYDKDKDRNQVRKVLGLPLLENPGL